MLFLLLLTIALFLDQRVFGPIIGGLWGNYIIRACFWYLFAVMILRLPPAHPRGKRRYRKLFIYLAFFCVLIAILFEFIQGIFAGFGQSPYDRSLIGIAFNVLVLSGWVIGMECARSWFMNRHFGKHPLLGIALSSLLFSCFYISFTKIINLDSGLKLVQFLGGDYIPVLSQNVLTSVLVFFGGPVPAVVYRGGLLLFERLSPLLPGFSWGAQALFGAMGPALGLIMLITVYQYESRQLKRGGGEVNHMEWFLTSMGCILIIWFCMGVFSYSPRVIVSGSMMPMIHIGDVIIVKEISGDQVVLGDIILFPMENIQVSHRIIEVQQQKGKTLFITKGDANNSPDANPVAASQVKGKVIKVIPRVGWITLMMKDRSSAPPGLNN